VVEEVFEEKLIVPLKELSKV